MKLADRERSLMTRGVAREDDIGDDRDGPPRSSTSESRSPQQETGKGERGTGSAAAPTPDPPACITRVRIYHEGTFHALVRTARQALDRAPSGRHRWELVAHEQGVRIYRRRVEPELEYLRDRVDSYERYFYGRLAEGHVGADGRLRPRTADVTKRAGTYRQRPAPTAAPSPADSTATPAKHPGAKGQRAARRTKSQRREVTRARA